MLLLQEDVGFTMLNLFIGLSSGKSLVSSWHWRFCNERKQRGSSCSREHRTISRDWCVQVPYRRSGVVNEVCVSPLQNSFKY
ncbi:hypothetical protein V6N13_033251 [Hibiscus sabdariffa]